jgi:L-iditol 2-dehydrogenase
MSEPVPSSMRAAVLTEPGHIEIQRRPVPEPSPDEVLIRVLACGVCGSDVHYYRHGRIGDFVVRDPIILGHEASGVIVAVGRDVTPSRIGQRVSIEPQRPAGMSDAVLAGAYNLDPDMQFYATPPVDGAFCEYVTIQSNFAWDVPDHISDHAAALFESLSVAIAASRKARLAAGESVFVTGAGPIGLL